MRHWPLNRTRSFRTWAHFDPDVLLDMNPSFVSVGEGQDWVIFCRYGVPPQPGRASIWAVRVDRDLAPVGRPLPLIGNGTDPRAIMSDGKLLVFYALIDMRDGVEPVGSTMALAEFVPGPDGFVAGRAFALPKRPIEGREPADSQGNWEKNWVPFPLDNGRVGLIYAHEPWEILVLDAGADAPRLEAVHSSPAIDWDFGTIRGGTPPVPFGDGRLITFFHSSQVIGSRNVYSVGACVFSALPPYSPILMTAEPLLMARYSRGAARFGWHFAGSIVFPLGAKATEAGYGLVAGLDDGEIGIFDIDRADLDQRLAPPAPTFVGAVHTYRGDAGARLPAQRFLFVPNLIPGIPELKMVNFLKILAGRGRTFVDVGAHIGFYSMGLAPQFDRVLAFEPSRFQFSWLERNRAMNGYDHVSCEHVALGEEPGEALLHVISHEGGLNTLAPEVASAYHDLDSYVVKIERLDDRSLDDVDLIKIDVEGFELKVLDGARKTIATSRPPILIEVWTDPVRREAVEAFMRTIGYGFEPMFPLSPELVICFPQERRGDYAWFL